MTYRLKAWHLYFLIAAISAGALGIAVYYLQARVGLAPCPLCVLQRMAYIVAGGVALLALLHRPRDWGRSLYGGLMSVAILVGGGLAVRQLYLASHPSASCKISLEERLVNGLPTAERFSWTR